MISTAIPRSRSLRRLIPAFALVALSTVSAWSGSEYRGLTILHTNDTHGHLLPFSFPDPRNAREQTQYPPVLRDVGGIARRATLAHRIEAEAPGLVLLVDAGDTLDGTPFSVEYMGAADAKAMAAAGYDLRVTGNHDYSATLRQVRRNARFVQCPTVCANLINRKTGKTRFPAYKMLDIRGARVAVFGLTLPSPSYRAAREGLDFIEPIQAAKDLVPKLRKQADIVIAITHIGLESDRNLAQEVPGIDVIVGGHSHTRLPKPLFITQEAGFDPFKVGGTVIVQDFMWGGELGRLDLRLHSDGGPYTLMSYEGKLLPVTADIPDDPATAKVVSAYYRPMSREYDEVIGEATATFYNDRDSENTVLNLICDAIRETAGTPVAIYNMGGARDDLLPGPIRMWDVATILPFQNRLVVAKVTGSRLKRALTELKPGVSGVRYRIEDDRLVEATIDGKPIDDSATYEVATVDYVLQNGLKDVTDHRLLGADYRGALKSYIQSRKVVSPVADGRRVVRGTPPPM